MIDLWLVGIGTGNPSHVTLEGQQALRDAAAVMIPRKGASKADLAELRLAILHACASPARVIEFDMPSRDESLPYAEQVERWHDAIADVWAQTLARAGLAGPVALMVWGDPALYDSTLRIAARLESAPRLRVVPGITALQALTAAHAIPLTTINGAVTVTTGRRLRHHGWPEGADTVAVMLDGECSFSCLNPSRMQIWWGAFLGMPDQILDAGPLAEAGPRIQNLRAEARKRHGWIMDTYLLRRSSCENSPAWSALAAGSCPR